MEKLVVRARAGVGAEPLARTIKKLAPKLKCAGCEKRDFALIEEPRKGYRSVVMRQRQPHGLTDYINPPPEEIFHLVATVVCTNCGLLHHFSYGVLTEMADPSERGEDVLGDE